MHSPRLAVSALLLAASLAAGGCAAPVGDFGRPRPSVVNDEVLPFVGGAAARLRGEPVSAAPFTDDERLLRDLAFAILMPPDDRQLWERTLAEWRRTRLLPERMTRANPANYANVLLNTSYRSSTARYARLIEDIRTDSARPGPFFDVAARVAGMDDIRERAMEQMWHLRRRDLQDAAARIAENRMIVDWVQRRFAERHAGYQLALDRLVLATPAPAAVEAERALALFGRRIAEYRGMEVAGLAPAPAAAPGGTVSK